MLLGKFLPPHAGHMHLVRSAQTRCQHLTVLVCSIRAEPIPGKLRFAWMQELFPDPDIRLVHVSEEVPQAPEDSPDFWPVWTRIIRQHCPELDVVFSSETYGDDIARHMNCVHVPIDIDRKTFPVSGTMIRNAPLKHWDFIPEPVRPWFVRRIALVGPESTGKSTLARELAEYFETSFVEEFARNYMDWGSRPLRPEDILRIGEGQMAAEDAAVKDANRLLFCDTNLVSTEVWSELYFGQVPEWIKEESLRRMYGFHLLLEPDLPWEDDGTREFPHKAEWHFAKLEEILRSRQLKYAVVRGSGKKRLQSAIGILEDYLADRGKFHTE